MVSPAFTPVGKVLSTYNPVFTNAICGLLVNNVTVGSLSVGNVPDSSDTSLTGLPFGANPFAVAVLVLLPVLMSACVMV